MASQSFSIKIDSIILHKFESLATGLKKTADKVTSLNILPQVHEVSIYESIWSPLVKCELAVVDFIGLFTNWPLTGEEVITVEYTNVGDEASGVADSTRTWNFAIESITDIAFKPDNRAMSYLITCSSIENIANVLGPIQQGYRGSPVDISKQIFEEHIVKRMQQVMPSYQSPNIYTESNDMGSYVIVVPNMHPIAAIDMVNSLTYTNIPNKYTYLFYQNNEGFHFKTLQGLIDSAPARRAARNNTYKYISDEVDEATSNMKNESRVISKLAINRRHSTIQKVASGYFNNNLFEINIGQKAIHNTRVTVTDTDLTTIEFNDLNTKAYQEWVMSYNTGVDVSNRTKYVVSSRTENDPDFIVPMTRNRWGKDITSKTALAQIDLTAVIPGTNKFIAGDLFNIEIPEFHGFEDVKNDDLISGIYLITEIKHIIGIGGYQTTVLRLNKDSYKSSVDRPSRYTG
jgi:hypothetical protein